jgi:hypothetical protein
MAAPRAGAAAALLIVQLLLMLAHEPRLGAAHPHASVKLIIDTDIGGGGCNDVDDVVAVCMSHALQEQRGEAEILAVVQNTTPLKCAGAISILNRWYGRGDIPIGAYDIRTKNATLDLDEPLPYVPLLADHWPSRVKDTSQVPSAVAVYRRALAAQPDRSVTISSIGIHTNLAALLRSGPDAHSPLQGRELVRRKVAVLAVMGGKYGGRHGSHGGGPGTRAVLSFQYAPPHAACLTRNPADDRRRTESDLSGDWCGLRLGGPACNLCGGQRNAHNHAVASAASSYVAAHWPTVSKPPPPPPPPLNRIRALVPILIQGLNRCTKI